MFCEYRSSVPAFRFTFGSIAIYSAFCSILACSSRVVAIEGYPCMVFGRNSQTPDQQLNRFPRSHPSREMPHPCWSTATPRTPPSLIPETPAEPGAGAVITAREARRRTIVPVSVKRNVPGKLAPQFDIVARVQVEMYAAGFRDSWE